MSVTDTVSPSLLARDVIRRSSGSPWRAPRSAPSWIGQERVVDLTLAILLAGGHGLLIGVPGLAKTKLVETLGIVVGLDALRVQFTPDSMPVEIPRASR